jgi:hypothetical protein
LFCPSATSPILFINKSNSFLAIESNEHLFMYFAFRLLPTRCNSQESKSFPSINLLSYDGSPKTSEASVVTVPEDATI